MSKNSKKVIVVQSNTPLDNQEPLENDTIQASRTPSVVPPIPPVTPSKPKKVLTEAQKAVLAEGRKKGRATLNARNAQAVSERLAMQQRLEDLEKQLKAEKEKEFEDKLIKKAVSVKKKQIKRNAVLDQISDDDTNIEEIKEIKKRSTVKKPPVQSQPEPEPQTRYPKVTFV